MDVVWHNHISTYKPTIGFQPSIQQGGVDLRFAKNAPSLVRADRDEQSNRIIDATSNREMYRSLPDRPLLNDVVRLLFDFRWWDF
jgi:hypothetical protein